MNSKYQIYSVENCDTNNQNDEYLEVQLSKLGPIWIVLRKDDS